MSLRSACQAMDQSSRLISGRWPKGVSGCPEGPVAGRARKIKRKAEVIADEFGGLDALPQGDREDIEEAASLMLAAPKKGAEHRVRYRRLARQLINDVRERVAQRAKPARLLALEGLRPVGVDDGEAY